VADTSEVKDGADTFLYVVTAGDSFQKIGIANDPGQRLATLQSGCPLSLKLRYVSGIRFSRTTARELERIAHLALSERRLRGEWFGVDPETAAKVTDGARVLYYECGENPDYCIETLSGFA
jgi:hypothetical protein